jgi:hypothetical protein
MPLELLKPPTDTLYKFLAILGLLFFLTSIAAPIWLLRQLDNQANQYSRDLKLLLLNTNSWKDAAKQMERTSKESQAAHNRLEQTAQKFDKKEVGLESLARDLKLAREVGERNEAAIKEFGEKILEWQKQNAEVEYRGDTYESTKSAVKQLLYFSTLGLLLGLGMTVLGFTLWYRRTQQYEDLILKNKVEQEPNRIIRLD